MESMTYVRTNQDAVGKQYVRKLTYSALCLAMALVLPFLTGQIPEIGSMLCPMHIPALLCGFLCGWPWGLGMGLAAPLLRQAVQASSKRERQKCHAAQRPHCWGRTPQR